MGETLYYFESGETETVCDTVETEECYTKYVKPQITLMRVMTPRLRLSVRSATQSE